MAESMRLVDATPEEVFAVLSDGWSYPLWVVGATHIRRVDPGWPSVGTRIHHSVGAWPLMLEDQTEVFAVQPARHLELRARAWPTGAARVQIDLAAEGGRTRVVMNEYAESGPARLIPTFVKDTMLRLRNAESLDRLSALAENRPHTDLKRRPPRPDAAQG